MNICYPKIRLAWLPDMLGYGVAGSLLAGFFGVLHDQVTYSISHEYFTRLKFAQFQYADFGLSPRIFVAEIGFLATWWVGFFAAWFMARVTVPAFSRTTAVRYTLRGFLIVFGFAFGSSIVGYVLGILHRSDYSAWEDLASALGVLDLPNFVRVVYIHNASYLGGLLGLIAAIIYLRKLRIPNSRFRHQPLRRAVDRFMKSEHHRCKLRSVPAAVREPKRWGCHTFMKTTFTVLLLGLLLCGCSQRWAKSNTPAIDLVEAGKDIPWGNGVVVHVTKRTGNSIERVRITSTAPDGQQTTVTANNGTLTRGSVENPRDERFVRLTLREVTSQSARQSWTAEELMIVLGK